MEHTTKSEIFELINALTPNEKRYIRQFSKKSGEAKKNHIMLLEAIIKQDVYNEEKLKKKFKGTSIVQQWSRVKNYLYNYILRILQIYHQQDFEFEISNNLQKVGILYKKGIYNKAYKILMRTKQLAFEGSTTSLLPFIAEWEMRLNWVRLDNQETVPLLNYNKNNKWAIEVAENTLMYYYHQKSIISNRLTKRYLDMSKSNIEMLNSAIYSSEEKAKSSIAKYIFYTTKNILYSQTGQFMNAYHQAKKVMELHKLAPLLQKQAPLSYVTSLNNFILGLIETKQWDDLPWVLEEMDVFIQKNKTSSISVLVTSIKYVAILKTCIGTQQFEKGLEYKTEIEQFIANNKKQTDRYVQPHLLLHYLVYIYIVNEAFSDALKAIYKLEKIQKISIYSNSLLLLKLICLFEQDELLLLPYVIRSVYRNMLKKKNLYELERIILNLLKASSNSKSKSDLKGIFQRYWLQLKTLANTAPKEELELLEYFDYLAWIESKIKGIPLIELLRSNHLVVTKTH